jgi:transcription-repair coupling factor (superfamily II helicase)
VRSAEAIAWLPDLLAPNSPAQPTLIESCAPEARPLLVARSYLAHPRTVLVVTGSYDRALAWQAKLQLCGVPSEQISQLLSGSSGLFEDSAPEYIALSDRLGALRALIDPAPCIVIATPQAALERTLPREVLVDSHVEIRTGQEINSDAFLNQLDNLGYEVSEPVRIPGQYSRRGGIIDVFATGKQLPVRIELFGDDVESIRQFDPNTQRSVGNIPFLSLTPSRETIYPGGGVDITGDVRELAEREGSTLDDESEARLQSMIHMDIAALSQRSYFDRLDLYRPWLHPDSGSAIDLLTETDLLVLDEALELDLIGARAEEELGQALDARAKRGEMLRGTATDFMRPVEALGTLPNSVAFSTMNALPNWFESKRSSELGAVSLEGYRGRADALSMTLRNYLKENFRVVFTTDQPNRAKTVLGQAEIFISEMNHAVEEAESGQAFLAHGNLGGGFVVPNLRLAFVSDAELFGVARLKLPQKRFMEGAPIATVLDLKPGDYVVHINFGIGIFRGLTKKTVEGVEKEYLFIEYQAPDKLFVPAEQLDRIQKYLNPGDDTPKLNKLTGGEWQRTLGKAKEEAKAFARDLVKLYAQRQQVQRRPYGPDTPFQLEMETTFPWVETPSQLHAIREVKRDMETGVPMDRLVCGDVGFGKTEVAIRAAFKAVQSGRQVAVLCPTTILSEQHYRNFEERLGSFGTKLGLVNRFTHASERRDLAKSLKSGETEIIVGTHSLLGKQIEFRDLGMVIIDEEHKFGVKQKEMLKQLRTEVDVLSLSATPIPRTLSMALMDIRQMSLINDPPPGRLPIRTYVRPYAAEVVREAILREMSRGGQVFYVYNRVESIGHVAEKLRLLVPTARIGVGHGQMNENELEPIMVGFVKGEIDILLSTTIIENGIDISNANTLIVEGADRLGLSQLYQLRGRVGRSDRQAYAYFLFSGKMDMSFISRGPSETTPELRKKYKTVSEGAIARLQALQEFSSLGSGYSLAFRDLQIRGAGQLLGAKQSGTMLTVGYELYSQLITEAVSQLKLTVDGSPESSDDVRDPLANLAPLPTFEIPVVALLPEGYIRDQAQRLFFYQKMMSARDELTLAAVQAEVEDRYGRPTEEVRNAFTVMGMRILGRDLGIEKLDARGGRAAITFKDKSLVPIRVFAILGKRNKESYVTRDGMVWPFTGSALAATRRFLDEFLAATTEVEESRARLDALG